MKLHKVVFHFDNENLKTLQVEGENKEDVLRTIYGQGNGFYDGTAKNTTHLYRINLQQVSYITVYDK
ncbi:hypothetical protein LIS82_08845 [Cytobacillus solani]|uniref:hypothetical protein n=1 Tax=Cytobacillus solani TaxID=1637975 RepID=UPI002079ADD4|nr:hypothetical protein [Cytobacillus solani]USK56559.1 hypothetical protein LIS82_08845 [Cytobacillus solani]